MAEQKIPTGLEVKKPPVIKKETKTTSVDSKAQQVARGLSKVKSLFTDPDKAIQWLANIKIGKTNDVSSTVAQQSTDKDTPQLSGKPISNDIMEPVKGKDDRINAIRTNLDNYVDDQVKQLVEKQSKGQDRSAIEPKIRAQFDKAKAYFTKEIAELGITPIERIAQMYDYLPEPSADNAIAFNKAVLDHAKIVIEHAFDQHLENPEQYVSHGFDHTINVANYARDIFENNPQIVDSVSKKYGVTEGQAKFLLENVSFFHDFGYPGVGNRTKAVHAITGADIMGSKGVVDSMLILLKPDVSLDRLTPILFDLRDAVLFHSADTVHKYYDAKLVTTNGEFLVDADNIMQMITQLSQDTYAFGSRHTLKVLVSNEELRKRVTEDLNTVNAGSDLQVGFSPITPLIEISGTPLKGRSVDFQQKNDQLLGLEYSDVDVLDLPLHTVIRLADNMDIRKSRFSDLQKEPAFQDIYTRFGDNGQESIVLFNLQMLSEQVKKGKFTEKQAVQSAKARLLKIAETLDPDSKLRLSHSVQGITQTQGAEVVWKQHVIESVIQKYPDLTDSTRDKLRSFGLAQDTVSMRHFGGCEAVMGLKVDGAEVKITVDGARYRQLNAIRVKESSMDTNGKKWEREVGVGEYQIWRMQEAYKSISVGGRKMETVIVDEQENKWTIE